MDDIERITIILCIVLLAGYAMWVDIKIGENLAFTALGILGGHLNKKDIPVLK